jgi:hypothetical protein
MQTYQDKHSDFCFVVKAQEDKPVAKEKQPKEKETKEKKEVEDEDLDLFVLNQDDGVLFADSLEEV